MCFTKERTHVVLTVGIELHILEHYHCIRCLFFKHFYIVFWFLFVARKKFLIAFGYTSWSLQQTRTSSILTNELEYACDVIFNTILLLHPLPREGNPLSS